MQGLQEAVARGEVGWLDVDPKFPVPAMTAGVNLILYHVGGNCYIGSDCDRFPASQPTGDRWGGSERTLDLNDPQTRKLVVADLIEIVQQGDKLAPEGSIVGVHLDNVHKLDADGLAKMFNDYLQAVGPQKSRASYQRPGRSGTSPRTMPKRSGRRWRNSCSPPRRFIRSTRTRC